MTTYVERLALGSPWQIDATVLIEGIPFLFGTRDDMSHPLGASVLNPPPDDDDLLLSVAAIDVESISIEPLEFKADKRVVMPSKVSCRIGKDPRWNRFFERRRNPRAFLMETISSTDTDLVLNRTTDIAAGDVIYLNREAILVGAVDNATDLSGCTRNYCAMPWREASIHVAGTKVTTVPRGLLGRPAEFRLWLDGEYSKTFSYVQIKPSPKQVNNQYWVFDFDTAMRFFERKCALGFKGAALQMPVQMEEWDLTQPGQDSRLYFFATENFREFQPGGALDNGQVQIDMDSAEEPHRIVDIDEFAITGDGNVTVRASTWSAGLEEGGFGFRNATQMCRVYMLDGTPMRDLLKVLLSVRGDGTNHATYDCMFGIGADGAGATLDEEEEPELRMGAGIPADLVDVEGLEALDQVVDGWSLALGAGGKQVDLISIFREVGLALHVLFYVNNEGKLTARAEDAAYPGDAYNNTIDETEVLRIGKLEGIDDEAEITPTLAINCNLGKDDKFYHQFHASHKEQRETYRDIKGTVELSLRGLLVTAPNVSHVYARPGSRYADKESVRMRMERSYVANGEGVRKFPVEVSWKFSDTVPGERLQITHPDLLDFAGSTLEAEAMQVLRVAPNIQTQRVGLLLRETWAAKYISPTGVVASYNAGTLRITLKTNTMFGGGTAPARFFAAFWKVKWRTAVDRYASSEDSVIFSIISDTVIELGAVPTVDPAVNDWLVQDIYADSDGTEQNAAQGVGQRDYAFAVSEDLVLGADDEPHEWG